MSAANGVLPVLQMLPQLCQRRTSISRHKYCWPHQKQNRLHTWPLAIPALEKSFPDIGMHLVHGWKLQNNRCTHEIHVNNLLFFVSEAYTRFRSTITNHVYRFGIFYRTPMSTDDASGIWSASVIGKSDFWSIFKHDTYTIAKLFIGVLWNHWVY